MKKYKTITKSDAQEIFNDLSQVLADFASQRGLVFSKPSKVKFDSSEINFNCAFFTSDTVETEDSKTSSIRQCEIDLKKYHPEFVDFKFVDEKEGSYTVIGYKPRANKYKFVIINSKKKEYVVSYDYLIKFKKG